MDLHPGVMKIKTKVNRWDVIKLKSFCTAKVTINKTKRQPTEGEKIFANHMTKMELILGLINWHFSQRGNADGQQAH